MQWFFRRSWTAIHSGTITGIPASNGPISPEIKRRVGSSIFGTIWKGVWEILRVHTCIFDSSQRNAVLSGFIYEVISFARGTETLYIREECSWLKCKSLYIRIQFVFRSRYAQSIWCNAKLHRLKQKGSYKTVTSIKLERMSLRRKKYEMNRKNEKETKCPKMNAERNYEQECINSNWPERKKANFFSRKLLI